MVGTFSCFFVKFAIWGKVRRSRTWIFLTFCIADQLTNMFFCLFCCIFGSSSLTQTLSVSTFVWEIIFTILIIIIGLLLFAFLIGNMQVSFLQDWSYLMFIFFSLDLLLILIGPLYLSGVRLGVYLKMDTKELSCLKRIRVHYCSFNS